MQTQEQTPDQIENLKLITADPDRQIVDLRRTHQNW